MVIEKKQFPLGLCVATLVATGLGLWAALAGVQWGAQQPRSDVLAFAWDYVNLALGAVWFLIWPAAIYRRNRVAHEARQLLLIQLPTILVAAIPAVCIAAWLSMPSSSVVVRSIGLQLSFALFAFGVLVFGRRDKYWQIVSAGVLAVLYVAMPALTYLQLEFLPAASTHWLRAIPALALTGYDTNSAWSWGIGGTYVAIGALLAALPRLRV